MLGCEFIVSGEGWREELREGQPRRRAEVGVGVGDDELLESRGGWPWQWPRFGEVGRGLA
jgi:hypothetical protein